MKKINAGCLVLAFVSMAVQAQSGAGSRPDDLEVNCTPVNNGRTECTVRTPTEGVFVVTANAAAKADEEGKADRSVDATLWIAGKQCNSSTHKFNYSKGTATARCKPTFLKNITYTIVATSGTKGSTALGVDVTVLPDVQMNK
jgi:hypothetical protein